MKTKLIAVLVVLGIAISIGATTTESKNGKHEAKTATESKSVGGFISEDH